MSNAIRSTIASILCLALTSFSVRPLVGQTPASPHTIRIIIVEGEEAQLQPRVAREPLVQLLDENNRPVSGAIVAFTAPAGSGQFANGARSLTVTTDQQGLAKAAGFRPNSQSGEFVLQVLARYESLRAESTIRHTNVSASAAAPETGGTQSAGRGHSSKWIVIGAIVAGGALAGAVAAGRGGGGGSSSKPATTGVTITPGTGSVSAPAR